MRNPRAALGPFPIMAQHICGLKNSPTVKINELSNALKSKGQTVYKFGLGQSPFPVPKFMQRALVANVHQKDYLPVNGLPELREAVATYQRGFYNLHDRTLDDVLIGPGTKQLIYHLQLGYYGELILPRGSWVSYAPQAVIANREIRWVDTSFENGWKVTAPQLKAIFEKEPYRPRVLLLNYPSNPHGLSYSREECQAIAEVAREFSVLVLSDEIYHKLYHKPDRIHHSIATYYPEGTVILDGISKWAGAGGWRCGAFSFPPNMRWLLNVMSTLASETYTSVSAPIQHAAVAAWSEIENEEMQTYLRNSCRILDLICDEVHTQISAIPGCRVHRPEGGFYVMPDFSGCEKTKKLGNIELEESLLVNTGVAGLGGHHFGRRAEEMIMRFAFVDFDGEKALEAIEGLSMDASEYEKRQFVNKYAPRVIEGLNKLQDFFEN